MSSTMKLQLICGRRKLYWILLYVILFGLGLAAVYHFIQHESHADKDVYIGTESSRKSKTFSSTDPQSNFYVAAVIEYEVLKGIDVRNSLQTNLQFTLDAIAECRKHMVDIVVFPEGTLYGYSTMPTTRLNALYISSYVPSPSTLIVPCDHEEYKESHLRKLSCAAKQNKIYVAVNVIERVYSPKSLYLDGFLLYNTEVVFDRNGMVIARYRKFNLYVERWINHITAADEPEVETFKTDFGVEFGIFICFDIFFVQPTLELVQKRNVTHFIYSASLINRLPFLTASSILFGWSYALDVIILASNAPYPTNTIGTNIYFGRRLGARTYVKPLQTSNIIITPVPKKLDYPNAEYPDQYKSLQKYIPNKLRQSWYLVEHIIDRMTTKKITIGSETSATFIYKSATFECNIRASWDRISALPNYQFVAYSGLNNSTLSSINYYTEMCGVTLCSQANHTSCLQPPSFNLASHVTFQLIEISARSTVSDSIRVPIAVDSNLDALDGTNFDFSSSVKNHSGEMMNHVNMILKHPNVNLFTFGIYKFGTKPNPATFFTPIDIALNLDTVM